MPKTIIPEASSTYIKFASHHLVRGMLACLRATSQPGVLLKQASANMPRLQDQAITRVIAEHEFARMLVNG
jgi:hypothetical protein